MPDVLFISKPVAPPWNDSNKNLVRDVARGLAQGAYHPRVLTPAGAPLAGIASEAVYSHRGGFAPSRVANAGVLVHLLTGPRADVWHFFFGPNPLTLRAGRAAARVRNVPTVHTLASAPDNLEKVAGLLFADRVIALSVHTAARLATVGVRAAVIPPALETPVVSAADVTHARAVHGLAREYVLFPGDLEFGDGAQTFVRAAAAQPDLDWVVAARPKTPRAAAARAALEAEARDLGAKITWLGDVPDIHALVAGAALVALPSRTLHAKMDWPLVLLEALALGVPAVVTQGTAAAELVASGAVDAVAPGDAAALLTALRYDRLRSPEARAARREGARRWVRDTCAPAVVAGAHAALYDDLLRGRAGREV